MHFIPKLVAEIMQSDRDSDRAERIARSLCQTLGLIIIADSVSIYDIRPLRFARKKRLLLVEYFSFFRL